MTPDQRAELRSLADRVRRIRSYSNVRPHVFLEDKDEIARAIVLLASSGEMAVAPVVRDLGKAFGNAQSRTVIGAQGRAVTVERRSRH